MKVGDLVRVPPLWANRVGRPEISPPALIVATRSIRSSDVEDFTVDVVHSDGVYQTWYNWQLEVINES